MTEIVPNEKENTFWNFFQKVFS